MFSSQWIDAPSDIELRHARHYINLTNGVEAAPLLSSLGLPFSALRIPSTCSEQQDFQGLLDCLDADLLLNLALGHTCARLPTALFATGMLAVQCSLLLHELLLLMSSSSMVASWCIMVVFI